MLVSPIELKRFGLPHVENSRNGDGCMELDSSNLAHLLDHLLGLDQHERNSRFQCGATNKFITRYFLGINWQRHIAIACRKSGLVIGIAELASLTKSWRQLELYPTPRESEDPPCQTARSGFYRTDDTARLSGHRIAAKPDRVGSGRVGRSSSGPTCERAGVARRWDELRGDCEGPVAGRRHHPHLVSPV